MSLLRRTALFVVLVAGMTGGFVCSAYASGSAIEMDSYDLIKFPSLSERGIFKKKPEVIDGYLLKADAKDKAPVVIIRPPCHGLILPKWGTIRLYDREAADVLQSAGFDVFLVDGFSPRHKTNICETAAKDRRITRDVRIKDTIGALKYLQTRKDIDSSKIFLLTFGANGGLSMLNTSSYYHKQVQNGFAGAAMFYPQCDAAEHKFSPYAPIQVFVGEKDAWNPARYCQELKKRKTTDSAPFHLKIYPDTYHAFANKVPPHVVQGPPGVGKVTAGGNPDAAADAFQRTVKFFNAIVKGSAQTK